MIRLPATLLFVAAMLLASGGGVIDYALHVLAKNKVTADRALDRAKAFALFVLGGLATLAVYVAVLAITVRIGGIS
jgi:uncharacterized membrane protein YhaH (DUF805 family)